MRQLDLFSALQSSTEGIDTEFKSARGGMPGSFLGVLFRHGQHPGRHHCVGRGRKAHRPGVGRRARCSTVAHGAVANDGGQGVFTSTIQSSTNLEEQP